MTLEEFSRLLSEFKTSAFRLETLQAYKVDCEAEDFAAYLKGVPLPPLETNLEWRELIEKNLAAGKTMTRVHLLEEPLTPYIRFEIEWAYYYSVEAGEVIRICRDNEALKQIGDFWLFDESTIVKMNYGPNGEFLSPEIVSDSQLSKYLEARDLALAKSVLLQDYLAERRQS